MWEELVNHKISLNHHPSSLKAGHPGVLLILRLHVCSVWVWCVVGGCGVLGPGFLTSLPL